MSKWKRKTQTSKVNWCFVLKSLFKLFVTPEKRRQSSWNKGPTVQTNEYKNFCCKQAIKSIHYEVYYCSTVHEAIVSDILLQDNVWIDDSENEEVRLLWFTGMF